MQSPVSFNHKFYNSKMVSFMHMFLRFFSLIDIANGISLWGVSKS